MNNNIIAQKKYYKMLLNRKYTRKKVKFYFDGKFYKSYNLLENNGIFLVKKEEINFDIPTKDFSCHKMPKIFLCLIREEMLSSFSTGTALISLIPSEFSYELIRVMEREKISKSK